MATDVKIGFPPGLLCESSIRLDVPLYKENAFVVCEKPAGIFLEADGIAENPKTIIGAIKAQENKPEFARLGLSTPFAVYDLEPEISGLCLIAANKEAAAILRNSYGSEEFEFEFLILSEKPYGEVKETVSLPILRHEDKPRAIVSHHYGKKCTSKLALVEDLGDYQIWSLKTKFLRWHQVRLHAAEAGLRPVAEDLYVRVKKIYLSSLKKGKFKGEDTTPIYDARAYHLQKISFNYQKEKFEASAPLPKKFELLLKKIRENF